VLNTGEKVKARTSRTIEGASPNACRTGRDIIECMFEEVSSAMQRFCVPRCGRRIGQQVSGWPSLESRCAVVTAGRRAGDVGATDTQEAITARWLRRGDHPGVGRELSGVLAGDAVATAEGGELLGAAILTTDVQTIVYRTDLIMILMCWLRLT